VVELVAYGGNRDYEIDEPNALSVGTLGMLGINAALIGERDFYAIRHAEHLTADSNLRPTLEFAAVSLRREIIPQARSSLRKIPKCFNNFVLPAIPHEKHVFPKPYQRYLNERK
jgi:hypothetical protein